MQYCLVGFSFRPMVLIFILFYCMFHMCKIDKCKCHRFKYNFADCNLCSLNIAFHIYMVNVSFLISKIYWTLSLVIASYLTPHRIMLDKIRPPQRHYGFRFPGIDINMNAEGVLCCLVFDRKITVAQEFFSSYNFWKPSICWWFFFLLQKYMTAQIYNMYVTTKILTTPPCSQLLNW